MPVDVRGLSLRVLAVTTALWVLYIGRSLFVPILFGIRRQPRLWARMVDSMAKRWQVPRALGAALLLGALLAGSGAILYRVAGQATELADELPRAAREIRHCSLQSTVSRSGPMAQMQEAADELASATASPGAAA